MASRRYVFTQYRADDHVTYNHVLHDAQDTSVAQVSFLADLFEEAGVLDGDEVELVVRRTGRRPFGDRKIRLVAPHGYKREPGAA